jgi:hypothetical protein
MLPVAQLLKSFPAFYLTQRFFTVFTFLILSTHLYLGLPGDLFRSGFTTCKLCVFLCSPIHATYPALDHSTCTWRIVQVMKFIILQFSTASYSSLLGPNILFSTLFSDTSSLCSSSNVRYQFSPPYRITDKIIVLYIQICTILDSRQEDRRFWTEW